MGVRSGSSRTVWMSQPPRFVSLRAQESQCVSSRHMPKGWVNACRRDVQKRVAGIPATHERMPLQVLPRRSGVQDTGLVLPDTGKLVESTIGILARAANSDHKPWADDLTEFCDHLPCGSVHTPALGGGRRLNRVEIANHSSRKRVESGEFMKYRPSILTDTVPKPFAVYVFGNTRVGTTYGRPRVICPWATRRTAGRGPYEHQPSIQRPWRHRGPIRHMVQESRAGAF